MSYDMTGKEYEILYKRYLKRPVDELLLAGGDIKDKSILDISAGNMRLSKRAIKLGCRRVGVIEPAKNMLPYDAYEIADIGSFNIDDEYIGAYNLSSILRNGKYDFAFCQQAINYWFEKGIENVIEFLDEGGKFIFNTFNKKPTLKPQYKTYTIDKKEYCECWQLVNYTIYHTQMCKGMKPHHTSFKWIDPEKFDEVLSKYFSKISAKIDGHTTIYVCEK